MFELLNPRCSVCGKRIDTRKNKEGIGGGFIDAICYRCLFRKLVDTFNQGDNE